ncbi:ATP-binding protein [Gallibacterium salpingitidis]|uniref:ATP-binding protein n=1 Tax=Gallibacterium salpingitidis TaxID=505341 RepID=UPI00267048CA|nr:ATP-binding protein [Gallibacterium salpingitidis]WKT00491.1 ATP-binding protein [Gallibacterium salpingitidis]
MMSIATLILGESGTGKSTSLRNLNPNETLLIQVISKPLPFRTKEWKYFDKETCPAGNVFVCDNADKICEILKKTKRNIIVIDDFQYLMANEFMRRAMEKGYDKFTEIGLHAWQIFDLSGKLEHHKRVYILSHTQSDEYGKTKIKTIGKMLDEKITLDGIMTVCLRTHVSDGKYQFLTQNDGNDTTKSPMGLFETRYIDNDLKFVDDAICDYWGIVTEHQATEETTAQPQENNQ